MGTYEFLSLFEHILTDRGSEFGDPDSLETGITGFQRFIIAEILCFITISGFKNQNFKYVMEFTRTGISDFKSAKFSPYTKFYHHLMFAFTKEKGYEKRTETG